MSYTPTRRVISTMSAGRGRVVTVFFCALRLRHEIDFRGETIVVIPGLIESGRAEAVKMAREMIVQMKTRNLSAPIVSK